MNSVIIIVSIIVFYIICVFLARLDAMHETIKITGKNRLNSYDLFFILFPFLNLSLTLHFITFKLLNNISKFLKFIIPEKFKEWFITIK